MKKTFYWCLVPTFCVALVAVAGMIKFNVLADDIYLAPNAIKPEDLLGRWVAREPSAQGQSGFVLLGDGVAQALNHASAAYREWDFNGHDLILYGDTVGDESDRAVVATLPIDVLGKHTLQIEGSDGSLQRFYRASASTW